MVAWYKCNHVHISVRTFEPTIVGSFMITQIIWGYRFCFLSFTRLGLPSRWVNRSAGGGTKGVGCWLSTAVSGSIMTHAEAFNLHSRTHAVRFQPLKYLLTRFKRILFWIVLGIYIVSFDWHDLCMACCLLRWDWGFKVTMAACEKMQMWQTCLLLLLEMFLGPKKMALAEENWWSTLW